MSMPPKPAELPVLQNKNPNVQVVEIKDLKFTLKEKDKEIKNLNYRISQIIESNREVISNFNSKISELQAENLKLNRILEGHFGEDYVKEIKRSD